MCSSRISTGWSGTGMVAMVLTSATFARGTKRIAAIPIKGMNVIQERMCSYCVQRIEQARVTAHQDGREIRDGAIVARNDKGKVLGYQRLDELRARLAPVPEAAVDAILPTTLVTGASATAADFSEPAANTTTRRAAVIDFQVEQEDSVFPMVPAGADLNKMIRRPSAIVETAAD